MIVEDGNWKEDEGQRRMKNEDVRERRKDKGRIDE
jgi:hypothetical protein